MACKRVAGEEPSCTADSSTNILYIHVDRELRKFTHRHGRRDCVRKRRDVIIGYVIRVGNKLRVLQQPLLELAGSAAFGPVSVTLLLILGGPRDSLLLEAEVFASLFPVWLLLPTTSLPERMDPSKQDQLVSSCVRNDWVHQHWVGHDNDVCC